jgi:1-acyl-sn-glycerol-3-phosphate acyltransferase
VKGLVNAAIRGLLRILCRIDTSQLQEVPRRGPLIIVTNHINFLEVPLLYTFLQPRSLIGLVKAETWDRPFNAFLANLWEAIPIRREATDLTAFRQCLQVLREGKILILAPEGTRSGDGRLRSGHPGVVHLALRSRVPLLPLVHWGGELFWENLRHLRRTPVRIRVGELFTLEPRSARISKALRQRLVDEIMLRLAALLPPDHRGVYADLKMFPDSHLQRARLK